jgi:hypothetical protein
MGVASAAPIVVSGAGGRFTWNETEWNGVTMKEWLDHRWHVWVLCRLGRHWRKFGTHPRRGLCVYCGR